ncbi:hypothetical protein QZH41_018364 [Actinostola sp. cb2023]|nr:hypothetical protein QZH41_018364 [Actinostola sp. cb2023]
MEDGEGALTADQRHRTLTVKALQNAIEQKRRDLNIIQKKLRLVIANAEKPMLGSDGDKVLSELEPTASEFKSTLQHLTNLCAQDKSNEYDEEAFKNENQILNYAYVIINRIKSKQTDKSSDKSSRRSNKTLSVASTNSSARLRAEAAGEAAAARKNAEYERLIAEKELQRKQREADDQNRRERERAIYEKDMALLTADRNAATANAKLEAIEQAIDARGSEISNDLDDLSPALDNRTEDWVLGNQQHNSYVAPEESIPRGGPPPRPIGAFSTKSATPSPPFGNANYVPERTFGRPFLASTPVRDITGSQLLEALTTTNRQIVAGLARQNLPKCDPDTFDGDATLFHPWKKAFKAMLSETEISPDQEVNYLRKFTSGEVQRVVDNFRKRQQRDPVKLLRNLWSELERRFGSPAVITNALLERLHESATFTGNDNIRLQEFADICADVDSQIDCLPGLACLNFPNAIVPITEKMPSSLRGKWEKEVVRYAEKNQDAYPGFHALTRIVQEQARLKNHPNIVAGTMKRRTDQRRTLATNFSQSSSPFVAATKDHSDDGKKHCLFHDRDGHNLTECHAFKSRSLEEKTDWIQKAGLCFLCLSKDHRAKECKLKATCEICGDNRHIALLHRDKAKEQTTEGAATETTTSITNKCTAACDNIEGGLSCSKIVLVDVFMKTEPTNNHRVYAIIDDQSNASLISNELADILGASGPEEKYFLSTCHSSNEVKYGRRVSGLVARSALDARESDLPTLIECENVPSDKREIPNPEMARRFSHLRDIADEIPPIDESANIHILLGRDAPEILKVRAFKNGPRGAPWAQKLLLGWTVSGQTCLDLVNEPVHVRARRTKIVSDVGERSKKTEICNREVSPAPADGKECDVVPCPNKFEVTDDLTRTYASSLKDDVFYTEPGDNDVSLSLEDRKFLEIMEDGITKNKLGNWEMPLPFRRQEVNMPNNRSQAMQRFNSLMRTLNRKPQMKQDYAEFMEKIISKGHASRIPTDKIIVPNGQVWYLPHFGVYHPKKPTQIRVVFDSSAEYDNVSLNKELLSGPDLANSLVGVLIRFRRERVAVMCDIEQMFHSFHVSPKHRNFLRFLWFEDNDPQKAIVEYRMNVHLFGNGPSPAVVTFGLRKTSNHGEETSPEVKEFVSRNFYVDDELASAPTPEQAISLVSKAQSVLATANLRLHKVVSNSIEVMQAFPTADRAKDLRDLDLTQDSLPAQRSLGVYWDLENDSFTAGSTRNDQWKDALQQLVVMGKRTDANSTPLGWDDPLPERAMNRWQGWKNDLRNLEDVSVPRCYRPKEFGTVKRAELHAFSDASQDAIATAVYLREFNQDNDVSVTLVYGQEKVAPVRPTSIPRLELCGAVMATQAVSKVLKEIDIEISEVVYYTDSQVVLGYITNEILVTLMAEVSAIVNARPIASVPTDVDDPQPLSPSMILTMKTRPLGPPPGEFLPADLYARRRWKRAGTVSSRSILDTVAARVLAEFTSQEQVATSQEEPSQRRCRTDEGGGSIPQ